MNLWSLWNRKWWAWGHCSCGQQVRVRPFWLGTDPHWKAHRREVI